MRVREWVPGFVQEKTDEAYLVGVLISPWAFNEFAAQTHGSPHPCAWRSPLHMRRAGEPRGRGGSWKEDLVPEMREAMWRSGVRLFKKQKQKTGTGENVKIHRIRISQELRSLWDLGIFTEYSSLKPGRKGRPPLCRERPKYAAPMWQVLRLTPSDSLQVYSSPNSL